MKPKYKDIAIALYRILEDIEACLKHTSTIKSKSKRLKIIEKHTLEMTRIKNLFLQYDIEGNLKRIIK